MGTGTSVDLANRNASNHGRYSYSKELGRGGFGTVFKATESKTKDVVAIKIIEFANETEKNLALEEARTLQKLSHGNVVRILDYFDVYGWTFRSYGVALVMEFCSNGSLSDLLESKGDSLSCEQRFKMYKQLLSGLVHVHGEGIVHRDIKPDNILVDQHEKLKIADVGLAKTLVSEEHLQQSPLTAYMKTIVGTRYFMAPEVYNEHYTAKSDIFSMGLVMFVICELPPDMLPKISESTVEIKHFSSNDLKNSGLGYFFYSTQERSEPMKVLVAQKCLEEEKEIFNLMLQAEYHNRPEAPAVLELVAKMERVTKEQ